VCEGKPRTPKFSDAKSLLELLWLLVATVLASTRPHQDVVLENMLHHVYERAA
jgi:hypothetical protein